MSSFFWKRALASVAGAGLCAVVSAAGVSDADQEFMKQAAQAGQLEIQASMQAEQSARSQEVKDFARMMVEDHGKADVRLKEIAEQKGVMLPAGLDDEHKDKLNDINALQGDDFDRQYAAEIGVAAHQDAVKLFEEGAKHAKDEDVKAFAKDTLPTLKDHLEQGKKLHEQIEKGKP